MHAFNCFVTLTYSDEFLPADGSLRKRDTQLFMKRLRKHCNDHLGGHKLRFLLCGEYGDSTHRPHYHALLFGMDFPDKKKHSTNKRGNPLYVSETLDKLWGLGHCYIGALTKESAGYTCRYALKKVNGDRAEDHYKGREPEFIVMSRKPGIGAGWFDKFGEQVYRRDRVVVKGAERVPPPFYDRILKKRDPERLAEVKKERQKLFGIKRENSTPDRLAVREECLQARLKTFQPRKTN